MFRLFLPFIRSSAQAVPTRIDAPAGVKLHLTGTDVLQSGDGTLYCRTRGPSERGEIVWKVENGQSVIVLEPGRADAFGNGSLQVIGGGGYLVTVTESSNQIALYELPGWVRA
jgi:hypothetical protein